MDTKNHEKSYEVGDLVAALYDGGVKLLIVTSVEGMDKYHYRALDRKNHGDRDSLSARIQETYKGSRVGILVGRLDNPRRMLIHGWHTVRIPNLRIEAVAADLEPSDLESTQRNYT